MTGAISLAMTLLMQQPVFCHETLAWDGSGLAIGYTVAVSFVGPDEKYYMYTQRVDEARATLLTPYGRKCIVTVAALYRKENGDVYSLTSEPFEFEGCASKKKH